jgi:hypothetical protein
MLVQKEAGKGKNGKNSQVKIEFHYYANFGVF